jgi:hypothetical protein
MDVGDMIDKFTGSLEKGFGSMADAHGGILQYVEIPWEPGAIKIYDLRSLRMFSEKLPINLIWPLKTTGFSLEEIF